MEHNESKGNKPMRTMCVVWSMNKNGEWYYWGYSPEHGHGWGVGSAYEMPQIEAVEFAKSTMSKVAWVWGVKVVDVRTTLDKRVDRFLSWPLPKDFAPDGGISFAPLNDTRCWPIGTNLFTAEQARKMIEHILADA